MSADFIIQKNYFEKRKNLGRFSLVQLGRMQCHPSHTVGIHTHLDWFELTSVIDGEGFIQANNDRIKISKGDVYLSFPCETHAIYSSEKSPLRFDFLSFVPVNNNINDQFEVLVNSVLQSERRLIRLSRIPSLCDGCVDMFLKSDKDRDNFVALSLELIYMEIMSFFKDMGNSISKYRPWESELCSRVENYIDTHIFAMTSLTELSKVTSYNYSYLSNVYKKATGKTISQYYNEKRFEKAKILLNEGGRSVTEISSLLGYNSVYAFSKAFKDKTGICPKSYQHKL